MGMPKYRKARDANEGAIFETLRHFGLYVFPVDVPCDALVSYGGMMFLVEIKSHAKAGHTPAQVKFYAEWTGPPVVRIDDVAGAERWAAAVRRMLSDCVAIPHKGSVS